MRMSQDEHLRSTNNVISTDQSKSNLSKNYNKNGKDVKSQNEIFDSRLSKLSAAYGKPMYLKTQFNFAMNEHLAQKKSVIMLKMQNKNEFSLENNDLKVELNK